MNSPHHHFSMPQTTLPNESRASNPSGRFIYIACPWTPVGGGMFKVADYLIQAQAQAGQGGVQLRPLDTRGGGHAALSLWVLLTALAKLVRGRLGGKLAGVHVNMAERLSLWRKSAIIVTCRALGVPAVLHLHAAQLHHYYRALPSPLQRLTRWVFSLPESVVVLGTAARRFVTEELGVPPQRVEVVINGVPEPVAAPHRRPSSPDVRKVLFLGNLSERKGVSDLLRALARPGFDTAKLQVCLAGGGDVPAYKAMASILGVDGFVQFEGWCAQSRVAELLAQTDVLVLPSYDEGLPLVILEALAHGVAVVCTPVGEIPSALSDGVNACFVTPGDIDGIAAALQKLLREPETLERLGRNGRLLYEQEFSIARFFASVARIHQRHFGAAAEPTRAATLTEEIAR
jgi:glycosyltransferase involved in cell wall biosynthesis